MGSEARKHAIVVLHGSFLYAGVHLDASQPFEILAWEVKESSLQLSW